MDDQKCDQKASGEMAKDKHSTEWNGTDTKHMEVEVGAPFGTAHPFRYGFCGLLNSYYVRSVLRPFLRPGVSGWTRDAGFRVFGPGDCGSGPTARWRVRESRYASERMRLSSFCSTSLHFELPSFTFHVIMSS